MKKLISMWRDWVYTKAREDDGYDILEEVFTLGTLLTLFVFPTVSLVALLFVSIFQSVIYGMFVITPFALNVFLLTYVLLFSIYAFTIGRRVWIRIKFSEDELAYLPSYLYKNKGWVNILRALLKASENHASDTDRAIFHCILDKLFLSTSSNRNYQIIGEKSENMRLYDIENAILWSRHLSSSPLLERIAVLTMLKTREQWAAFNNRSDEEMNSFVSPFEDFYHYMNKVLNDIDFRREELSKLSVSPHERRIEMKQQNVQKQIDEVMAFALKEENNRLLSVEDLLEEGS